MQGANHEQKNGRYMNPGQSDPQLRYEFDRGTAYEGELHLSEAFDALIPESELTHPDQRIFQVTHLSIEYYWYAIHYELRRVIEALRSADYTLAFDLLRRAVSYAEVSQVMLRAMVDRLSQIGLLEMRNYLPENATGWDSPGALNMKKIVGVFWKEIEAAFRRHDHTPSSFALMRMEFAARREPLSAEHGLLAAIFDEVQRFDVRISEWRQLHLWLIYAHLGGYSLRGKSGPGPSDPSEVVAEAAHSASAPSASYEGPVSLRGRPITIVERAAEKALFPALWSVPDAIYQAMTREKGK